MGVPTLKFGRFFPLIYLGPIIVSYKTNYFMYQDILDWKNFKDPGLTPNTFLSFHWSKPRGLTFKIILSSSIKIAQCLPSQLTGFIIESANVGCHHVNSHSTVHVKERSRLRGYKYILLTV